jgi:hypothetical protein
MSAERTTILKGLAQAQRGGVPSVDKKTKDKQVDKAVDMTFPASDPTAHGTLTGTEEPCRPADRKAPVITKEQIEAAARGEGHARNHPRAK